MQPAEVTKTKVTSTVSISMWDRWKVDEGDITLGEFIKFIEENGKYKATVAVPEPPVEETTSEEKKAEDGHDEL